MTAPLRAVSPDAPTPSAAAHVVVPREVVEHLLDWHNKQPCGAGQESYDEVIFDALRASLGPEPDDRPEAC